MSLPLEAHHQYQGRTNDCAPFTAAMVINALRGAAIQGEALAREMNRPCWRWTPWPRPVVRRVPNWATFPWGVADVLRQHGIPARWRFLAHEEDLLRALENGRVAMPIVGGFRPLWAHIRALVAHDSARGWGFVDPGVQSAVSWQSHESFRRKWGRWGNLLVETLNVQRSTDPPTSSSQEDQ